MKSRMEIGTGSRCVVCNYAFIFALELHHVEKNNSITIILCRNCHRVITIWITRKPLFAEYYQSLQQEEKAKLVSILSSYEHVIAKMLKKCKVGHPELGAHITLETTPEDLISQSKENPEHIARKEVQKLLESLENGQGMRFGDICTAMAKLRLSPDQVDKALRTLRKWNKVEHPKFGYWAICKDGEVKC